MAESKNNIVIQGFSGKLGNMIVFRQRAGKTIAATAPGERVDTGSPAQQAVRQKFQLAVMYGKSVIADAAKKAEYQAAADNGQSAYNVAVADFWHAPDITEIDVSKYSGLPGQPIRIRVMDDFMVKSVMLAIHNEDGTLVEEGEAVQDTNGLDWTYTTTVDNPNVTMDRITVTATDQPDNLTVDQKTL